MIRLLEHAPEPLLWAMAGQTLLLVLTVLALGFVWLAMPTD